MEGVLNSEGGQEKASQSTGCQQEYCEQKYAENLAES